MATEAQFEFFKFLYEEENGITNDLQARAKHYITLQTAFIAAVIFKFTDIKKFIKDPSINVPASNIFMIAILLSLSLLLCLMVLQVRDFEGVADPEEIIEGFSAQPPLDAEFRDDRIADFAVATNHNAHINSANGSRLLLAGWLMFAALMYQMYLLLHVLSPHLPILP
jgi:hypothetical protein